MSFSLSFATNLALNSTLLASSMSTSYLARAMNPSDVLAMPDPDASHYCNATSNANFSGIGPRYDASIQSLIADMSDRDQESYEELVNRAYRAPGSFDQTHVDALLALGDGSNAASIPLMWEQGLLLYCLVEGNDSVLHSQHIPQLLELAKKSGYTRQLLQIIRDQRADLAADIPENPVVSELSLDDMQGFMKSGPEDTSPLSQLLDQLIERVITLAQSIVTWLDKDARPLKLDEATVLQIGAKKFEEQYLLEGLRANNINRTPLPPTHESDLDAVTAAIADRDIRVFGFGEAHALTHVGVPTPLERYIEIISYLVVEHGVSVFSHEYFPQLVDQEAPAYFATGVIPPKGTIEFFRSQYKGVIGTSATRLLETLRELAEAGHPIQLKGSQDTRLFAKEILYARIGLSGIGSIGITEHAVKKITLNSLDHIKTAVSEDQRLSLYNGDAHANPYPDSIDPVLFSSYAARLHATGLNRDQLLSILLHVPAYQPLSATLDAMRFLRTANAPQQGVILRRRGYSDTIVYPRTNTRQDSRDSL